MLTITRITVFCAVHLGLRLLIQEMQGLLDSLESASMDPLPKARLTDWVALIDDVEESTRKGEEPSL